MNWYLHEVVEVGAFDGERRVFVVSKSFDVPNLDRYRIGLATRMKWGGVEQVVPEDYDASWIPDETFSPEEIPNPETPW